MWNMLFLVYDDYFFLQTEMVSKEPKQGFQ